MEEHRSSLNLANKGRRCRKKERVSQQEKYGQKGERGRCFLSSLAASARKQKSHQKSSGCPVICFTPICVRKEKEQLAKQAQQTLGIVWEHTA